MTCHGLDKTNTAGRFSQTKFRQTWTCQFFAVNDRFNKAAVVFVI